MRGARRSAFVILFAASTIAGLVQCRTDYTSNAAASDAAEEESSFVEKDAGPADAGNSDASSTPHDSGGNAGRADSGDADAGTCADFNAATDETADAAFVMPGNEVCITGDGSVTYTGSSECDDGFLLECLAGGNACEGTCCTRAPAPSGNACDTPNLAEAGVMGGCAALPCASYGQRALCEAANDCTSFDSGTRCAKVLFEIAGAGSASFAVGICVP